jgi:hypothetical protein
MLRTFGVTAALFLLGAGAAAAAEMACCKDKCCCEQMKKPASPSDSAPKAPVQPPAHQH